MNADERRQAMREQELRKASTCCVCGKKIGQAKLPFFWRVTIERHGLDLGPINRQQGLAMLLGGNAMLAQVMGQDEEMTVPLMDPVTVTVCDICGMADLCLAALAEVAETASATDERG